MTRAFFHTLLMVFLLAGLVPYQSAYCLLMKRTIEPELSRMCAKHRTGLSVHPASAMRLLEKPLVAPFHHGTLKVWHASPEPLLITLPVPELPQFTGALPAAGDERPPPDIVIRTLNLRI